MIFNVSEEQFSWVRRIASNLITALVQTGEADQHEVLDSDDVFKFGTGIYSSPDVTGVINDASNTGVGIYQDIWFNWVDAAEA